MSIFSGKCDVYDHFMMFGEDDNITQKEIDEKIANSKICICTKDGKEHKLDIKNTYDLAPYFPYIIGLCISSNENNFMIISSESYVDCEEKSFLEMYLNIMLKNVRRCKRKKQEITEEEILKDVWNRERDYIKRMVDIVKKNGTKTTINDIVGTIESAFSSSPETPKEDKKSVTLEEVRAVLAEKSREGKTAEVKGLLTKFGVNKLSELDASKYDELLKETEGI
jgi:hypothetical protein